MDTERPTLSTDEVITGCIAAGATAVTVTKLGRWARFGLLAPPERKGKQGSRGVQWRWDAECLPRAGVPDFA